MLLPPFTGRVRMQHNTGTVGATTLGTAVTTGAGSSTKGTAVELITSTSFEAWGIMVTATNYGVNAGASEGCLDILTGAATEDVLIPNLLMGYCGTINAQDRGPKSWFFPLYIPSGTRIAAQVAGIRLSTAMRVAVWIYGGTMNAPWKVGRKVTTYGIGTVPNGTSITPGDGGAEGLFTQITASTSENHFALFPSFQCSNDTSLGGRAYAVDIGVGAATEDEVSQGYWYGTDNGETMGGPFPCFPTFIDVPSGTRLALRASCSGVSDTVNAAIHAVS